MSENNNTTGWVPTIIENKLIGPFPETLDLSVGPFPKLDYSSEPSLYITSDKNVKKIILPCSGVGIYFLFINDLPLLEEIHLTGDSDEFYRGIRWISVKDVPSLKNMYLRGSVCRLEVVRATSLSDIDLSGCLDLDYFRIDDAPDSFRLNVLGCCKLREVVGLDEKYSFTSDLSRQIDFNQKTSRHDGMLYERMTFTDIDMVVEIINEGVKAASRRGLIRYEDDDSIMGRYYIGAYDPQFKPYTFRVLEPLEPVYTGGTGETYSYVFIQRYVSSGDFSVEEEEGAGNHSPETCLSYMLHWTRMGLSHLPGIEGSSDDELLATLRIFATENPENAMPDLRIKISALISNDESRQLLELASQVGMMTSNENIQSYAFVFPNSGIPEGEMELVWGADLRADLQTATKQLTQLGDLFRSRATEAKGT